MSDTDPYQVARTALGDAITHAEHIANPHDKVFALLNVVDRAVRLAESLAEREKRMPYPGVQYRDGILGSVRRPLQVDTEPVPWGEDDNPG